MTLFVGTSGWQYRHWRGAFYPEGLAQARWLEYYAERFDTVEVNNAFYRLPEPKTFEDWKRRTPRDFVAAVKASRYLSHVKRLREPREPVERLLTRARLLGRKLGPVLVQLPSNFRADLALLDDALGCFPRSARVAFEPRHDSWFSDNAAEVLARHQAALCLVDVRGRRSPLWRTADWGYIRFHQGRARPSPCYGRRALETWAEEVAALWPASANVFVFFNNDTCACALRDASWFAQSAERAGLRPSRVPSVREVRVGSG